MAKHRYDSINKPTICFYQYFNDWNDWYIELYYPCENKEQLNKREGEIIREIGTVNKTVTGRTHKEYYETNKGKLLDKMKEYRQNNKRKKENMIENMQIKINIRLRNIKKKIQI